MKNAGYKNRSSKEEIIELQKKVWLLNPYDAGSENDLEICWEPYTCIVHKIKKI